MAKADSLPGSGLRTLLADLFEVSPADGGRLRPMEGLRGVAVFLVFLVHYCSLVEPWLVPGQATLAKALHAVGNIGVDLFFMLSGYLIYGSLVRKPQQFIPFMRRRTQRLYPAFLVVLAIYIVLSFVFPYESKIPTGVWLAFVYIVANILLLPGMMDIQPIITVAWSLSYEMFFYLSIPMVVGVLALRRWPVAWRVGAFLGFAASLYLLRVPHIRIVMFVCGMILVDLMPQLRARMNGLVGLDLLAVLVSVALVAASIQRAFEMAIPLLFAACFLVGAAAFSHNGPLACLLNAAWLRRFGNMSYSYYLLHGLVLKAFFLMLAALPWTRAAHPAWFWALLPFAFAATVVSSACLYLLVERPFSILPGIRRDPLPRRIMEDVGRAAG